MSLYVLDENNNKIEVTDKVLSAIVQQVVCCVSGTPHSMAFVTQAKYNELKAADTLVNNGIYFITDDTTADDIDNQLATLTTTITNLTTKLNNIITGAQVVQTATSAKSIKPIYSSNSVFSIGVTDTAIMTGTITTSGYKIAACAFQVVENNITCYLNACLHLPYNRKEMMHYLTPSICLIYQVKTDGKLYVKYVNSGSTSITISIAEIAIFEMV